MAYSRKANWAARPAVSVALRYGLAVVSVAVAFVLTSVWLRNSDSPLPFTGFALSAIGITFWKARTRPGLLAAFLATLVRSYFFAPATTVIARMLYDSLFLLFALLMIWITRSRNELEEKVAERTAEFIAVNDKLKIEIAERKRAEVELRLIIDTVPIMVWRKLPDGSADLFNQEFRKYTGLSEEEGLGWSWINVFHPDDRLTEEWHADFAAGKPFEKEARLRRADGEYRWFLVRAVPVKDDRGKLVKWFGLSIDVDDLKKAEDRIRLIINTIPTLAWSLRPDGIVDFVNQRWLEYTGLTLEQELAEPTRPVHPEDLARVMEKWRADMAAGQPSEDEIRLQRADEAYRWFLVRTAPLRDERGNVVKWFGISIDIDDRKRMESQIRLLLDAIPQQIWSGPPDGTLDYCNARWRSFMGLELEELRGAGWQRTLHPDDRERVLKAWHESVTNATPYEQEERHRRADGQYRWFLARGVPLRGTDGRIVRWYGTNTDIEDRKHAEEELQRLSGELLQSQDEERRRISRDLHDSTGQDLAALTADLSQLGASIPSSARKLRALASRCQELAEKCIREVRTLSYLIFPPMLDETGLADAIRHFGGGFTDRSGIKVGLEVNAHFGRMRGDIELALFRVVQESLTNVHRHSGSLRAKILLHRGSNYVTVEVSDTGQGTSGRNLKTNTGTPFQIGVGISSMTERVKLVGGRLDIISGTSGTTVRATIPIVAEGDEAGTKSNA
jgi:PAS domain S-box-containing protein